jgi:hypothetical protein
MARVQALGGQPHKLSHAGIVGSLLLHAHHQETHRHRFTNCNASHDPSSVRSIMPTNEA